MDRLGPKDWLICGGYLAVIVGLGFWFSRRKVTNDEYFFGGRNMHWLPVGLSLFASTMSSNSFVGLPAEAAFRNYHQLLAIFFIPFVVVPVTCIWFIPFYRSFGFNSLYEYLERRFARPVRFAASTIFMVYLAGWMGTMLVSITKILNVVLDTQSTSATIGVIVVVGMLATAYTAMGGVKAVIWTDTIQAFALFGGMIVLFIMLINRIDGGIAEFFTVASRDNKFEMFQTTGGLGERNLFSACAMGFFVYLAAQTSSYGAYQRYVTVNSVRAVRMSLIVKGVFIFVSCSIFFFVGTALYVFYSAESPQVMQQLAVDKRLDQLMPHFVVNFASGTGMLGLVLAGLFAAAMSSLDTGINSMTATVVTDWKNGAELGTTMTRIVPLLFGSLATGTACLLSVVKLPVFDILLSVSGATLGLLMAVLLMGMLSKRANTVGVIAGVAAGLVVFGLVRFGLAELSAESFRMLGPLGGLRDNTWWDGLITTVTAVLVGMSVSVMTKRPSEDQLEGMLLSQFHVSRGGLSE